MSEFGGLWKHQITGLALKVSEPSYCERRTRKLIVIHVTFHRKQEIAPSRAQAQLHKAGEDEIVAANSPTAF